MTACGKCMRARRAMVNSLPKVIAEPLAKKILTDVPAQTLIDEARKLIGIKYLHQGRTRIGLDCVGLVELASKRAGIEPCDIRTDYSRDAAPDMPDVLERCFVPTDGPKPGGLLVFKFGAEAWPRHFGIYTERDTIIHSNARYGRVLEHGLRGAWLRWLHSSWLIPGIKYTADQ